MFFVGSLAIGLRIRGHTQMVRENSVKYNPNTWGKAGDDGEGLKFGFAWGGFPLRCDLLFEDVGLFFWKCGSSINSIQWYFWIKFAYLLLVVWLQFLVLHHLESSGSGSICHILGSDPLLCILRICHRWPLHCILYIIWLQASAVWTCLCHPRSMTGRERT